MRNIGHGSHHSQFQSIILIILPNARSTKFKLKILFGYSTQTIQPIGCQSRRSRGITIAACSPQTLPHPAVLLLPRRRWRSCAAGRMSLPLLPPPPFSLSSSSSWVDAPSQEPPASPSAPALLPTSLPPPPCGTPTRER